MHPDSITAAHRSRLAYVYIRQSSPHQVLHHQESQRRQRALVERAVALGWPREHVTVSDDDFPGPSCEEPLDCCVYLPRQQFLCHFVIARVGGTPVVKIQNACYSLQIGHDIDFHVSLYSPILYDAIPCRVKPGDRPHNSQRPGDFASISYPKGLRHALSPPLATVTTSTSEMPITFT